MYQDEDPDLIQERYKNYNGKRPKGYRITDEDYMELIFSSVKNYQINKLDISDYKDTLIYLLHKNNIFKDVNFEGTHIKTKKELEEELEVEGPLNVPEKIAKEVIQQLGVKFSGFAKKIDDYNFFDKRLLKFNEKDYIEKLDKIFNNTIDIPDVVKQDHAFNIIFDELKDIFKLLRFTKNDSLLEYKEDCLYFNFVKFNSEWIHIFNPYHYWENDKKNAKKETKSLIIDPGLWFTLVRKDNTILFWHSSCNIIHIRKFLISVLLKLDHVTKSRLFKEFIKESGQVIPGFLHSHGYGLIAISNKINDFPPGFDFNHYTNHKHIEHLTGTSDSILIRNSADNSKIFYFSKKVFIIQHKESDEL